MVDRLHVQDVGVSVEAPTHAKSGVQSGDYQCVAACHTTRVIAIANGRFVDIYGASGNSLHPFAFLQQIAIADHVVHPHGSLSSKTDSPELNIVVVTSVAFPVPGFLLVGAFVDVPGSEISGTGGTVNPTRATLLLGFRLYAGSVTQCIDDVNGGKPSQVPASIQVYFSFVEPVVDVDVKSIRCLQSFSGDMTPDAGSVLVLFEESTNFGVFTWKERFSDRQICLAQMKQQSEKLVVAELSPDGRYLVLGDAGRRLSLIDFRGFYKDENDISSRPQRGKRLQLGACFSSGLKARDNPLEHVRLIRTLATSSVDCAFTSLRWWICGVQGQQKQFVLAGKRDGSLNVFKVSRGNSTVQLKLVQMYPGLASGTHDAVRSISKPLRDGKKPNHETWFEFCLLSDMRWRVWRVQIAGENSKRHRVIWPSVRDSLDFPSFTDPLNAVAGSVLLQTCTEFSKPIAKALSNGSPDHTSQFPIVLLVAADRLQIVGLLTKALVEITEASLEYESSKSSHDDSEIGAVSEREETQQESVDIERSSEERNLSEPTTIQDKYKLPPVEWKTRLQRASHFRHAAR
ncbi:hypothetical protein V7S43_005147 [Phytophthora oleae]|uniref:Uncharacterized protein n=1 Tax=Phytophthora oleae TaxID=2107226 RepID=A0ABD3FS57_9STRA